MTADDCRAWRELLGAYTLGQLPDSERAAMVAHLEGCPDCRAEAAILSPMATMLRRAGPAGPAPTPRPEGAYSWAGGSRGPRPRRGPAARPRRPHRAADCRRAWSPPSPP